MSKLLNLAVHWPSKVWPVGMTARKICSTIEGIFKFHYTTWHFIPKKCLSLVFYYNRNLKISKFKKSEQCFRDKIVIYIRLFDEQFACHFESQWRETWRHTGRRTVSEIPPPPHPRAYLINHWLGFHWVSVNEGCLNGAWCSYSNSNFALCLNWIYVVST